MSARPARKSATEIILESRRAVSDLADYADEQRQRANFAEYRLRAVRRVLEDTHYFSPAQIGDDLAPRVVELVSFLRSQIAQTWNNA